MLNSVISSWPTHLNGGHLFLWQGGANRYRELPALTAIAPLIVELGDHKSITIETGLGGVSQKLTWLAADSNSVVNPAVLRDISAALQSAVTGGEIQTFLFDVSGFDLTCNKQRSALRHAIITVQNQFYLLPMLGYRSHPARSEPTLQLLVEPANYDAGAALLHEATAISSGMRIARQMADRPSQDCTPAHIAAQLMAYAQQYEEVSALVWDEQELIAQGMGALYAVGKGSLNPPRLVVLRYQGANDPKEQPYAVVGKGVTFDSGGLWLKGGEGMSTMKYDMCGAAVVFGLLDTVRRLQLPINLDVVLVLAENMPTDRAMRPGDVITTYSGHTVEIINTDAEGRLVLADGIAFADRQLAPRCIIDVATLTGAVVKALGYDMSGLICNDVELLNSMMSAAQRSVDAVWPLPFDERFEPQVKSNIADFTNTPPNSAAIAVSAGYFLSKFCGGRPWAHLDVSGTALRRGEYTQASGRPIPLLTEFFLEQVAMNQGKSL